MKPITDFNYREKISPAVIDVGSVFELAVPRFLPSRRVYLYLEMNNAGAVGSHQIYGVVRAKLSNRSVGEFPARIGDVSALNQSEPCIFNSGGNVLGDSMNLRLAQPFTATTSVVLQPLRFSAEIDALEFFIQGKGGTPVGFRVYLACLSSDNY